MILINGFQDDYAVELLLAELWPVTSASSNLALF